MDDYPDFIESTGYGDVAGLCGANCRHSFGPYFEGLSPEAHSAADLDEYADKTVTYNGEEMPYYDATQYQRRLERGVRNWKRRQAVKEAAGVDAITEKKKVREGQLRLKDFTEQTGLKRDYSRERIVNEK
jgi:Phage minor capsid protein 2.